MENSTLHCTAFEGVRHLASGGLEEVVAAVKCVAARDPATRLFVFDDATGRMIDIDVRESMEEMRTRLVRSQKAATGQEKPGPGRPKLGVVAREVTLLPRHWDWLNAQPGGASVTLRKLVEQARSAGGGQERLRQAQEAAYRFMTALAGDEPGYEEVVRALYARDAVGFSEQSRSWPNDVRAYAHKLATPVFVD